MLLNHESKLNILEYNDILNSIIIILSSITIIIIIVLLMDRGSIRDFIGSTSISTHSGINWNHEKKSLYNKLLIQSLVNEIRFSNNQPQLNYRSFEGDHPGHLTWDDKYILVRMIRTTPLLQARAVFCVHGNNLEHFYYRKSRIYPYASPLLLAVVRLG